MTNTSDFERAARDWLDAGSDSTPPRVIDAVLLAVRTTPQERDFRIAWRALFVRNPLYAAAAITLLAVAGLAAFYAFSPRPDVGPSVTASPSPSAQALIWSPERLEMDWPLPVREEPSGQPILATLEPAPSGRQEDPRLFTDPSGDIDLSAPGWVDLTRIEVTYATGESVVSVVEFDLATRAASQIPDPQEHWIAYGLVVDLDGDGIGDQRLGMDNAPSGQHRAWVTDLETGVTTAQTGDPYGAVGGRYFDTFLPGERPLGRLLVLAEDMGEFKFYLWASLIEDGRVVATDYAPDVGWFDPSE